MRSHPFFGFLARRLLYALLSLLVVTMVLYAGAMLVPPEGRAQLYIPETRGTVTDAYIRAIIRQHHLEEPYLVQYGHWMRELFDGTWGYSPTLREEVLPALLRRTPVTLELGLYSLLAFIPLGLWSGLIAGWEPGRPFDKFFRLTAFMGTAMPPFILGILLLAILYARFSLFPPGRIDMMLALELQRTGFHNYTGMMTVDALLNGRVDVFGNALKHLLLPVITLSLFHWATLGRVSRTMMMEERRKDYLLAARARGVTETTLIWRHALPTIMAPSLTGIALSAASIVTGVYVVEAIFLFNGISGVIIAAMSYQPDAPAVLGFSVYSVIIVVGLMLLLDILQALVDPRVRAETLTP